MDHGRVGTKGLTSAERDQPSLLGPSTGHRPLVGYAVKLSVTLLVGFALSTVSVVSAAGIYKDIIRSRADGIASALDARTVTAVSDAAVDTEQARQRRSELQRRIDRIAEANSDVASLALVRSDGSGGLYYLAGAGDSGGRLSGVSGQAYRGDRASVSQVFDDGHAIVSGPAGDGRANRLSAAAPVFDDSTYRMPAVLVLEVPAATYGLALLFAAAVPLLLMSLVVVMLTSRHRTRRRREAGVNLRAEMISIASHEIRTPLTGLRWSAENLLSKKLSPKVMQHSLEIMYDSAMRLNDSIEDILQLASMESEKSRRLVLKPADLRLMLDDIAAVQRLPAEQRDLTVEFSKNWPKELVVPCDQRRLKRVFNNVVSNAIKYSEPASTVTIGYGRTNDGNHIIYVQDRGIGIPADEQDKVWSGFYRATNTADRDVSGTGMGLYLSRAIVEQHGGHMWLESEVDRGTIMFVELPDEPMDIS